MSLFGGSRPCQSSSPFSCPQVEIGPFTGSISDSPGTCLPSPSSWRKLLPSSKLCRLQNLSFPKPQLPLKACGSHFSGLPCRQKPAQPLSLVGTNKAHQGAPGLRQEPQDSAPQKLGQGGRAWGGGYGTLPQQKRKILLYPQS